MSSAFMLENFLEMLAAERSASYNTLYAYKNDIETFLRYISSKNYKIEELTISDIENYLASIKLQNNFSPKTISRKISSIRQFFSFLLSEGLISKNITRDIAMPKKPADLPKAMSRDEIESLLNYANSIKTPEGFRDAAILELLYATGTRITELLTLKLQSIHHGHCQNENTYYILIKGKGGKERIVLIDEIAIRSLSQYLTVRDKFIKKGQKTDWLFPSVNKKGKIDHLTRQRFGQILKEVALNGGLNPKNISPHKIRHSFATHMLQNGANLRVVQELLGHSDISSTQIYTKITNEHANKTLLSKHPLALEYK